MDAKGHTAVERLAEALSEAAGVPVTLERPRDPAHGDYATNVALQLAPSRGPQADGAGRRAGGGRRGASRASRRHPPLRPGS